MKFKKHFCIWSITWSHASSIYSLKLHFIKLHYISCYKFYFISFYFTVYIQIYPLLMKSGSLLAAHWATISWAAHFYIIKRLIFNEKRLILNAMYISKHYFISVFISLLNISWSYPEKLSFKFTLFTLYLIHLHYKFYILHYNFLSFMLSILSLTFQVISFIL